MYKYVKTKKKKKLHFHVFKTGRSDVDKGDGIKNYFILRKLQKKYKKK